MICPNSCTKEEKLSNKFFFYRYMSISSYLKWRQSDSMCVWKDYIYKFLFFKIFRVSGPTGVWDKINHYYVLIPGVLVRSSLWLKYKNIMPLPDDDVSVLFCSITSVSIIV